MKILNRPVIKCDKCNCEFMFEKEDIQELHSLALGNSKAVICPICGKYLKLKENKDEKNN